MSFSVTTFSGSAVPFRGAKFSGSTVYFHGAAFSGGTVYFHGATFSDGTVYFDDATGAVPQGLLTAVGTPPHAGVTLPAAWLLSAP
ncbi:pentapeptide repeat-containing protein [Streptomyces griseus]|uniref:pentapeptide repeat-containing protein n=1 Tax=Streptomyces griseus TaxID=1911 RepID=UPI003CCF98F4